MSLPKEKLDEIIQELNTLNPQELEQVVVLIKDFKSKTPKQECNKPSDYFGAWAHLDFDVEKESRKLREEWNRNIL